MNPNDRNRIEDFIRALAMKRTIKLTLHAHQEMAEDDVDVAELLTCLAHCTLLEDYPEHKRGACCLICGHAHTGRYLHVVCTTEGPELIIITVYEPKPPKWESPFQRGMRS